MLNHEHATRAKCSRAQLGREALNESDGSTVAFPNTVELPSPTTLVCEQRAHKGA